VHSILSKTAFEVTSAANNRVGHSLRSGAWIPPAFQRISRFPRISDFILRDCEKVGKTEFAEHNKNNLLKFSTKREKKKNQGVHTGHNFWFAISPQPQQNAQRQSPDHQKSGKS
jgi:hypothetical protein